MTLDYSVIIPAYNEQDWLAQSLPVVHQAMEAVAEPGEVIVVDNNSSDRTAEVAREHGARVVFEPINQISRARNVGARAAHGRYLIFLDADTLLPPELLRTALDHLQSNSCCGGGALVVADQELNLIPRTGLGFWNWFSTMRGSAAGCFIYCRRDAFDQVSGFSEKVYASEELWLSRALRGWGRKHGMDFRIIDDPPVVTSSRKIDSSWRVVMLVSMLLLCPFMIFSRRLCGYWYRRAATRA